MVGLDLVRPLEDDWRDTLDEVARARGWPTSRDVGTLAARVAALSAAYNDELRARAGIRDAGAARLGFAFARDVPKGAAAVRELVTTGELRFHATGTYSLIKSPRTGRRLIRPAADCESSLRPGRMAAADRAGISRGVAGRTPIPA